MPRYGEVLSHWHYMADDFSTSALDFYSSVEKRLKDRCVPEMGSERNEWKEGGMLSANRQYLRLRRGRYVFDVCAAPYGKSFFFSWWLSAHVPAYVFAIACGLLFGGFFVLGLLPIEWVVSRSFSDFRKHAGKDFEAEILGVTEAVGPAL